MNETGFCAIAIEVHPVDKFDPDRLCALVFTYIYGKYAYVL
jgi:hypothetical protein